MWRPENSNDGISIPWTCVSLHAITSEPVRSIYMQLDFRLKWPGVYDGVKPAVAQNGNGNGLNGMAGQPGEDEDEDVDEGNVSGEYGAGIELHVQVIYSGFSCPFRLFGGCGGHRDSYHSAGRE